MIKKSALRLEEFQEVHYYATSPPRRREYGLAVCWILPREAEPILKQGEKALSKYNGWCYSHIKASCPYFFGDDAKVIHCGGVVQLEFESISDKLRYVHRHCMCADGCRQCRIAETVKQGGSQAETSAASED